MFLCGTFMLKILKRAWPLKNRNKNEKEKINIRRKINEKKDKNEINKNVVKDVNKKV